MAWFLGGLVLLTVGAALRHALRLGAKPGRTPGLAPLDPERQAIYRPLALEVETQAAILGISLNDAFEERDAGHGEMAWRMVRLSVGEWNRLADLIAGLLNGARRQLGRAQAVIPCRGVVADRFRSPGMVNFARMHELLDQLVFGSRLRFQLHLGLLRRAAEIVTAEFRRRYRYAERTEDRPEELWKQLDLCFHDFDLVAKEALLAFRTLLLYLPNSALAEIESDVKAVVGRGVRTPAAPVVDRR